MTSLQTDLYQLTMAAGYLQAGKQKEIATFELFVRRLPKNRDYLIAAGLPQAVDYLLGLTFSGKQIDYLRSLAPFASAGDAFWDYLRDFRFSGDLFAMREGTPFFPGEPVAVVRAPLIEAQIPETYLLSTVGFQSMIAAKAARLVSAAQGRPVIEFGTRRAHGPEAGMLAGRAAYVGGCTGTSNVEAAFRFGIPVFGTSAHSWVLAFETETEAFAQLQKLLGAGTTYLIDSYDTLNGARRAVALGGPVSAVRLDSGDLGLLAKQVRALLDDAGMRDVRIMATSDLNEERIQALLAIGAPIDSFGVGTELSTSYDQPALSAVYKLAEHEVNGTRRYTAKQSTDKATWPGAKQVFRSKGRDVIACSQECIQAEEALLQPVILDGQLIAALPSASEARDYSLAARKLLSPSQSVEYSGELKRLAAVHAKMAQ